MTIDIRHITDLRELLDWRMEVIRSVFGLPDDADLADLCVANRRYYIDNAVNHYAIVASTPSQGDCGCGALCIQHELPSPDNPTGICAYLMNIYVRPSMRSHGIAHSIVQALIDEARRRHAGKIWLESTPQGVSVYASAGFSLLPNIMTLNER